MKTHPNTIPGADVATVEEDAVRMNLTPEMIKAVSFVRDNFGAKTDDYPEEVRPALRTAEEMGLIYPVAVSEACGWKITSLGARQLAMQDSGWMRGSLVLG